MDMDNLIEKLEQMKNVDIRTVDRDSVVDARDIVINTDLPVPERIRDYISQGGNLYLIKVGNTLVKMSYSKTDLSVNDCFESYLKTC